MAFSAELGRPSAEALGLHYERLPDELLVPDVLRKEPWVLEGVGEYTPSYAVNLDGERPAFSWGGFKSPQLAVRMFGGLKCDFETEWKAAPSGKEAELVSTAIQNFVAAGPNVLAAAAPYAHQYYLSMRQGMTDEECRECRIPTDVTPENVWEHIELGGTFQVRVNLGSENPHRHPDSAYVMFGARCTWEEEHGIGLSFLNGNRITYVGSADVAPTLAAAYARPELLDAVFQPY